jgi:hypothetical protein
VEKILKELGLLAWGQRKVELGLLLLLVALFSLFLFYSLNNSLFFSFVLSSPPSSTYVTESNYLSRP